jgi:poly(U)-specific endoribonuclease
MIEDISVKSIGLEKSISKAVQRIFDLDKNRLIPGQDYRLNVQGSKKPYWKEDKAEDPLFTVVSDDKLQRPTYRSFIALLDNFSSTCGAAESVTSAEVTEQWTFLKSIMETAPLKFCHKYLRENCTSRYIPADVKEFQDMLYDLWFKLYGRSKGMRSDSSGFEHVFVGEIKEGEVSGLHNWIQIYLEEKKGNLDYRGYIKPRSKSAADSDGNDHVLTLQFIWNGVEKNLGTSFIGVSPEFEVAVYTLCFLMGQENNTVELNTGTDIFDLNIRCFRIYGDKIGTTYPEALDHH